MSLLSVVQDVCQTIGVTQPSSVFSGITANRTMQEMLSLANEMAQRIAYNTREWNVLKKIQIFQGDGVTEGFDFPVNYKRMLLTSDVWRSTSALQPMMYVPDTNLWMQRRALDRFNAWGEWTRLGGQMLIWPVMDSTVNAQFAYLDKNCIALNSGGVGDSFLSDLDSFLMGDRLLKLGMIWQWKAQKGTPYAEDMSSYYDALTYIQGADSPAPTIIGRLPLSASLNAKIAYPYPVPTP